MPSVPSLRADFIGRSCIGVNFALDLFDVCNGLFKNVAEDVYRNFAVIVVLA